MDGGSGGGPQQPPGAADDDFALFAADMVTPSVDCTTDLQSDEDTLPHMLRLGITRNEGLRVSPLNVSSLSYPNIDAMHSTGDQNSDDLSADGGIHTTGRSDIDMLAR